MTTVLRIKSKCLYLLIFTCPYPAVCATYQALDDYVEEKREEKMERRKGRKEEGKRKERESKEDYYPKKESILVNCNA